MVEMRELGKGWGAKALAAAMKREARRNFMLDICSEIVFGWKGWSDKCG